jgi:hypothetical protein
MPGDRLHRRAHPHPKLIQNQGTMPGDRIHRRGHPHLQSSDHSHHKHNAIKNLMKAHSEDSEIDTSDLMDATNHESNLH